MAELPRILVDANVFFNNALRNILMTFATQRVIDLRWTDKIEEEWVRNLSKHFEKKGGDPAKAARTAAQMRKAWPKYSAGDFSSFLDGAGSTDAKDRHVAAAALAISPSMLITHNLRDFDSRTLSGKQVSVLSPDRGLLRLAEANPDVVVSATRFSKKFIYNDDLSWSQYIDYLSQNDLPGFGNWLRRPTNDNDVVSLLTTLVETAPVNEHAVGQPQITAKEPAPPSIKPTAGPTDDDGDALGADEIYTPPKPKF
jgi:hypothetical protein